MNDFIDQHHPSLCLYLCFALSGSRFAAAALPSSAEEGSLPYPATLCTKPVRGHFTPMRRAWICYWSGFDIAGGQVNESVRECCRLGFWNHHIERRSCNSSAWVRRSDQPLRIDSTD